MKKAIVTIAIGKRFERMVQKYCLTNWQHYADKHGYDLIIIDEPLDKKDDRCVAWQKCLICSQEWSKKYDRILWVDTDIVINPNAPDIAKSVPDDKIGCVNEFSYPTRDFYKLALSRMYEHWKNLGYNPTINYSAQEYYKSFGIECEYQDVVQTGVMLFNPKEHAELLDFVFYNYEEKGLNYEMRPLSYEILYNNYQHWIDYRFNMLLQFEKALNYPFLLKLDEYKIPFWTKKPVTKAIINTLFSNSYFLHFTGATHEMKLLNWQKSL